MKRAFLFATVLALAATAWAVQPSDHIGTNPVPLSRSSGNMAVPAAPRAITWATIDSIAPAGSRVAAAAVNGRVYRLGGEASGGYRQRLVQVLDPATGVWAAGVPMPKACSNISATTWRDRIYVVGGTDSLGVLMDSLQVYDADSGTWHMEPPMPAATWGVGCAVLADTLYVCGGITSANTNAVYAYDLVGQTWTTKASLPQAIRNPACVALNGKLYCVGGYASTDVNTLYEYDPAANAWTTKTPMGANRGGLAAMAIGSRIYAMDGGWGTYLSSTEYYEPAADTAGGAPWANETANSYGRRALGFAALGNDAYLVGGWSGAYRACVERGTVDAPVVQDIVAQGIYMSPWVGNYGAVLHPYIGVGNMAPFRLYNIPVTLRIDSAGVTVYEHKEYYNLNGTSGYGLTMPEWRPCTTPGIAYNLSLVTSYTGDQNNANDTSRITVTVKDALWYQFDSAATYGGSSQNFEPAMDAYDAWLADDFWLEGVDSVRIDSITVKGSYSSTAHVPDSLSLIVTSDSSWSPAFSQTVASAMVSGAALGDTNGTFTARLSAPFVLPADGRYWLSAQLCMNFTPGGQWYWTDVIGSLNSSTATAVWMNPGNGFGTGYTHWIPSTTVWAGVSNFSFILHGGVQAAGVAGGQAAAGPRPDFSLAQVSPNPVRGGARFSFSLARPGDARLDVYSLLGQKVASVAEGRRAAGRHSVSWNGLDRSGRPVAAGLYFYRLTADGRSLTRKFVVVR